MTARQPLLAAVAFAVVLLVGTSVAPSPPGVTESGQAVAAWAADHGDALRWQAWIVMLAMLPGGTLVALVHRRIDGPEATAYLVGVIVSVTLIAVAMLLRLGLARHGDALDPGTARAIADIEAYWGPLLTFPIILQALALAVAGRRGVADVDQPGPRRRAARRDDHGLRRRRVLCAGWGHEHAAGTARLHGVDHRPGRRRLA